MGRKKCNKHSEKSAKTKIKKVSANDVPGKRILKIAVSHALSSGWVQNSGVASLVALTALMVSLMTSTQIKAAAITCAALGTLFLWILAVSVIRYSGEEKPAFAVAIETVVVGVNRDATQVFCEYNQSFLSPVPILMFLRLVNLQDAPSDISDLRIEVELKKGRWIFPSTWLRTAKVREYMPLLWTNPPPAPAVHIDLIGDRLEPILESHPLQPHQTLRGWVLLDVSEDFDVAVFPRNFRITVMDTAGHKITVLDSGETLKAENVHPPNGFRSGKTTDVRNLQIRHLADSSK